MKEYNWCSMFPRQPSSPRLFIVHSGFPLGIVKWGGNAPWKWTSTYLRQPMITHISEMRRRVIGNVTGIQDQYIPFSHLHHATFDANLSANCDYFDSDVLKKICIFLKFRLSWLSFKMLWELLIHFHIAYPINPHTWTESTHTHDYTSKTKRLAFRSS